MRKHVRPSARNNGFHCVHWFYCCGIDLVIDVADGGGAEQVYRSRVGGLEMLQTDGGWNIGVETAIDAEERQPAAVLAYCGDHVEIWDRSDLREPVDSLSYRIGPRVGRCGDAARGVGGGVHL